VLATAALVPLLAGCSSAASSAPATTPATRLADRATRFLGKEELTADLLQPDDVGATAYVVPGSVQATINPPGPNLSGALVASCPPIKSGDEWADVGLGSHTPAVVVEEHVDIFRREGDAVTTLRAQSCEDESEGMVRTNPVSCGKGVEVVTVVKPGTSAANLDLALGSRFVHLLVTPLAGGTASPDRTFLTSTCQRAVKRLS